MGALTKQQAYDRGVFVGLISGIVIGVFTFWFVVGWVS